MRRLILAIAALVLVVPLVIESGPELLSMARLALSLRGKTWDERRQVILGAYYRDAVALNRTLPPGAAVALIPRRPEDRDVAMFSVYHFYPRPARVYFSVEEWQRAREHPRYIVFATHSKLEVP